MAEDTLTMRKIAAAYLNLAEKATNPKDRDDFIRFAIHYHEKAIQIERRLSTAPKSPDDQATFPLASHLVTTAPV